jgi:hypothetical protein
MKDAEDMQLQENERKTKEEDNMDKVSTAVRRHRQLMESGRFGLYREKKKPGSAPGTIVWSPRKGDEIGKGEYIRAGDSHDDLVVLRILWSRDLKYGNKWVEVLCACGEKALFQPAQYLSYKTCGCYFSGNKAARGQADLQKMREEHIEQEKERRTYIMKPLSLKNGMKKEEGKIPCVNITIPSDIAELIKMIIDRLEAPPVPQEEERIAELLEARMIDLEKQVKDLDAQELGLEMENTKLKERMEALESFVSRLKNLIG